MLDDLVTQMMQSECKDIPERLTEEKRGKNTILKLHSGSACSVSVVFNVLNALKVQQSPSLLGKGSPSKGHLCCGSKLSNLNM